MNHQEAQFTAISIHPPSAATNALPRGLPSNPQNEAKALLHRAFSIHPTVSDVATKPQPFGHIGAGTCGTVFSAPSLPYRRVTESFTWRADLIGELCVPRSLSFVTADCSEFWDTHGHLFPDRYQELAAVYFTERIFPLPKELRCAIVDLYCPENLKQGAKEGDGNKDCLVRVYLGKRRNRNRVKPLQVFSLRNYNLCLDQMEELGLETEVLATTMAKALAVMHWEAGIDADDVEFVLGRARWSSTEYTHSEMSSAELEGLEGPTRTSTNVGSLSFHHGDVSMWLLDFNRCRRICVNGQAKKVRFPGEALETEKSLAKKRVGGTQIAVKAFLRNDPYYPTSSDAHEQKNWTAFRGAYLATGEAILGKEEKNVQDLPERFIVGVESTMKERLVRIAEAEKRVAAAGPRGWEEGEDT
ncbi:hypothetical protein MMC18_005682 [Xylographa bjoerkii]|nr:hypothetical protein [Xylographa bjoerkii]